MKGRTFPIGDKFHPGGQVHPWGPSSPLGAKAEVKNDPLLRKHWHWNVALHDVAHFEGSSNTFLRSLQVFKDRSAV
jgi:hypothetical protein